VTQVPSITCPGIRELELAIIAGGPEGVMRDHVHKCTSCKEQVVVIRENLEFMKAVAGKMAKEKAAPAPVLEPDALPGYKLVREIARGGQGVVYEGLQVETKRRVAVKMFDVGGADGHAHRRIAREAELAASLRHPNIVSIYQSTTLPGGRHALAMEFVDGVTLEHWAKAVDGSTPRNREAQRDAVRAKLRVIAAVCDAIHHAHINGVIHRDLKPGNVLVDAAGTPRVVDFGIARRIAQGTRITNVGGFAGTLAYASPEQVSGDPEAVDTRTDVYSVGLIMYEVLTGRRPYDTESSLSGAISNIAHTAPTPVSTLQPGEQPAGGELEAIVNKALAKDRTVRYQSAAALKSDIDNWLAGRAIDARQHSTVYILRKMAARHRVPFAAAIGLILVLAAFAAAMTWSSRRLSHQRTLLAESLASSTIERGRLVGINGENARAEELLWPELIKTGVDPADPKLFFESSPEVTQPAWAICELYSRQPSLLHIHILTGAGVLRFEQDGRAVLLGRPDGARELRAIPGGSILKSFPPVLKSAVRIMPDGCRNHAILGTTTGFTILDLDTSEPTVLEDPRLVNRIADLNSTGTRLLTTSPDGTLRLWQTSPLALLATITDSLTRQTRSHFSADGKTVITAIGDKVQLWSAADGTPVGTWTVPPALWASAVRGAITNAQLSPSGSIIAAGVHRTLLLFSVGDPASAPREIAAHRGFVAWVEFSKDGSVVLTSGSERNCRAWDTATGTMLGTFEQNTSFRGDPAISADGGLIAVADDDDGLRVFETRPRQWLTKLIGPENSVHAVRFSPDGRSVAAAAADGSVRMWDAGSHALRWATPTGGPALEAMSFAPDGRTIAVAGQEGLISILRTTDPSHPEQLARRAWRVTWLGHSPTGLIIAAIGTTPTIDLYDASSGATVGQLTGHADRVVEGAFSKDGSTFISVGIDGIAIVWDLKTMKERFRTEKVPTQVRAVAISPDGSSFATGSDDWKIRLWDAHTGRLLKTLGGAKQHVFGLVYHPKGNVLFSCTRDSLIQVWDVRTGRELAVLDGHDDLVMSMAVSPDGQTLATCSTDRTVGLWDLSYYQKHLAGNAGIWKARVASEGVQVSGSP
jgi:WD40 repeat protein/tRNA A-37 threonylcarbamoyl transferase component Bud32